MSYLRGKTGWLFREKAKCQRKPTNVSRWHGVMVVSVSLRKH
jgi:hypothetical protein